MTTQIDDIQGALYWLIDNEGLVLPHNIPPDISVNTEVLWENYPWNPLEGFDEPDPNGSPKPTWDKIVFASRNAEIADQALNAGYIISDLSQHRTALTDAATIEHEGESLYVGSGLDHMTGLLQMVEQPMMPGNLAPCYYA